MTDSIEATFAGNKDIKIMTHIVAGYPDLETSRKLILTMADNGADLIEIQIPFSDPLADGPTITLANQKALDQGVTPRDCFQLAEEMCTYIQIPLLFMTYANIAFQIGIDRFSARSAAAGISGLIIPDIPFDDTHTDYIQSARKHSLHPILVVSPDVSINRLRNITRSASGFIYTTLRKGITGVQQKIEGSGLGFIETIRKTSVLPVAAGFGISSRDHVDQLRGKADAAVIGSHLIHLFHKGGIAETGSFLNELRKG
jgi:tryptophan synthase alpha chain